MADEVRLIDAKLLTTNIAQIAKSCARSDAQKALVGRILFMIDNMPTIEAEPIHENPEKGNPESEVYCYDCIHNEVCQYCPHDGCDFKEKAESVKHGRWIVSHTQKHVEVTYECSECQHEVVGEYEKTPFCGGCGARMMKDGDSE